MSNSRWIDYWEDYGENHDCKYKKYNQHSKSNRIPRKRRLRSESQIRLPRQEICKTKKFNC